MLLEKLMFLKIVSLEKVHGVSCKVSHAAVKDVKTFIDTVCYSGKEEESLTEIKVWLYKQMKTKTSQYWPSDEKLMLQAIKCIHYQVCNCWGVDEAIINDYLLEDNGYIVNSENEEVHSIWFSGRFLISS